MAWETRNGSGRYYTRSRRANGRVVREYVGTGLIGELAASEDAERRAERLIERNGWNALKQEAEDVESLVDRFTEGVSSLMQITLVSAGYYRHNRGEWRRRGGKTRAIEG